MTPKTERGFALTAEKWTEDHLQAQWDRPRWPWRHGDAAYLVHQYVEPGGDAGAGCWPESRRARALVKPYVQTSLAPVHACHEIFRVGRIDGAVVAARFNLVGYAAPPAKAIPAHEWRSREAITAPTWWPRRALRQPQLEGASPLRVANSLASPRWWWLMRAGTVDIVLNNEPLGLATRRAGVPQGHLADNEEVPPAIELT